MKKAGITTRIRRFLESRPGFEPENYCGAPAAYRADYRTAYAALKDGRALLAYVEQCGDIDAAALLAMGSQGRLTVTVDSVHYCAGQYYPTEYRSAVCRYLASIIWTHFRDSLPSPDCKIMKGVGTFRYECDGFRINGKVYTASEAIHKKAREVFGRSIARRWFN